MPKTATPYKRQYNMQKAAAKHRGVDFELTFEEWRDWWGDDVSKRGRNHPQAMVMALIDKTQGYKLGNIVKRTKGEHSHLSDRAYNTLSMPLHTPMGEYASINKAARALGMWTMTVRNRCLSTKEQFADWYFIKET